MSLTKSISRETREHFSDEDREIVREVAELTGESHTLECRLVWIDERINWLRKRLAVLRDERPDARINNGKNMKRE